jgi:hypothetical protein
MLKLEPRQVASNDSNECLGQSFLDYAIQVINLDRHADLGTLRLA